LRKLNEHFLLSLLTSALLATGTVRADVRESVVTIYCQDSAGSSQGTGFILGPNSLIVTAYHVVQDAKTITIRDSSFKELSGIVVQYIDPQHDIAILKSEHADLLGLTPTTEIQASQTEIVIRGSPRGTPKQTFSGQITSDGTIHSISLSDARGRSIFARDIDVYTTDITLYSGMSGAPVLSTTGQVIGVLSGSYDEGRGTGWAIPITYALDLLNTPPKGVTAGQMGVWPALDLMGPSWISYKRSYSKKFDSLHIGQLEILETVYPNLRGKWTATRKDRVLSGDTPTASCYGVVTYNIEYTFDAIDEAKAIIPAHFASTVVVNSDLNLKIITNDAEQRETYRVACAMKVVGDATGKNTSSFKASDQLSVGDVASFSDKQILNVKHFVTDCTGDLCAADKYGRQDVGDFELISPTKIRWGDTILTKME
jgi:hypothetical protein